MFTKVQWLFWWLYNICEALDHSDMYFYHILLPSIKKRNERLFKRSEDFTFVADTFLVTFFLLMIDVNAAVTQLEKWPENIFRLWKGFELRPLPTHGRSKLKILLFPHWDRGFQIFASSASSKMQTDKNCSSVFVRTLRRAKTKLCSCVKNKS